MKRKVLSLSMALVLVLSLMLATALPAAASSNDREEAVVEAADRLVELQNDDGGFPWEITDPAGDSATNVLGVTATGILEAWEISADSSYETALALAYKYCVDNPPSYTWSTDQYVEDTPKGVDSNPDITFLLGLAEAAEYDADLLDAIEAEVSGTTASDIADLAKERWDTRNLTLGSSTEDPLDGDATGYAGWLRELLHGQDLDAYIPWDLELGVEAALALDSAYPNQDYDEQAEDIVDVLFAAIDDGTYFDSTDTGQTYYTGGLTGAVKASAETGLYETEADDLLSLLLAAQEDGYWYSDHAEGSVQATAYAVMALLEEGSADAIGSANAGADWLVFTQETNDGWLDGGGTGTEYAEIDSEAARALAEAAGGTTVGTTVEIPEIVAISVTPTGIDFGTLYPGQTSEKGINVDNIGTLEVDVDASLATESGTVFDNLTLGGQALATTGLITDLSVGSDSTVDALLTIPSDYSAGGTETNQIIFEAMAK